MPDYSFCSSLARNKFNLFETVSLTIPGLIGSLKNLSNFLIRPTSSPTETSQLSPLQIGQKQRLSLHAAAHQGDISALHAMIKSGTSIDAGDGTGLTALHWALIGQKNEALKYLIKNGAYLDAADETGLTPLHLAVINGNKEAISLLIEGGASTDAVDNLGYSALLFAKLQGKLPFEEIAQLFVKKSPNSWLYKQEFLYRKLLAHAFDYSASHDLILSKQNEQIVKTVAGFPPGIYFQKTIHESLELFCQKYSEKLSTETKELLLTACALEHEDYHAVTSDWLYSKWRSGKPIFIATGSIWHHVSVFIWHQYLVISNRGNGNEGKPIRVLTMNPTRLQPSIIQAIRDLERMEIDGYMAYMHDELPKELQADQSAFDQRLENYFNQVIPPQVAGNCAWANREGALRVLIQLHGLLETGIGPHSLEKTVLSSLKQSEKLFQAVSVFQKCLFVEQYLDLQENPSHPHYPSPSLLCDVIANLENTPLVDYPLAKLKLKHTLKRMKKFLAKIQAFPTSDMPPEVKSVWMSELEQTKFFMSA